MKFYFAAARSVAPSPVARALSRRASARAANDNGSMSLTGADDRLIHAALRHFSRHGLNAALRAAEEAESAFFSGDRQRYDWWRSVCQTLDRRMASELANRVRTPAG